MITIESDHFTAAIDPHGAELTSLVRKADGHEFIWTDTTGQYWGRHAPLLFPAIGKSNDDQYTLDGQPYPMRQHGFARDYEFASITKAGVDRVQLTLRANAETKAMYPFDFALTVAYQLTDAGLAIRYTVANGSREPMPFALGFHPGFALSQPLEDYTVTLNGAKVPLHQFGIGPVPFRNGEITPLPAADGNVIPLSHALLDDGLIIVDAPEATSATLATKAGGPEVTLDLTDFPYLTLWSPEGQNAPFVCVEPFNGLPDAAGTPTNWFKKLGNTVIEGGEQRTMTTTLTLG
ncbi:aldose 1-epimerase family protein [Lacticaseibacillus absianus]|uniref:aldose 1-epimerase family protein n=1 Tax=Lacticaseibacillus absianus TaxID=2729623 RepID=UPI0015CE1E2C|nr:aldose 1-epimerase family protein [Lacticaseibacillus absianus]